MEQHKPQSLRLLHLFDGQSAACAYSLNFNVINIGNIVIIIDNIVKRCFLISLDFLLFSFCICKLGVFLVVFGVFLTQKKSTDSVSFSTTFGELFLVYSLGKYTRFWLLTPVSVGVGSEIGQICGVFSSKDSKNAHFLTF